MKKETAACPYANPGPQSGAMSRRTFLVSFLAISSAIAHVLAAPSHFQEWWGYGMLFLVTALLQAAYGLGFLVREGRLATLPLYLIGGILGTLLAMEMYVVGRTVLGIPLLGPRAAVGPITPPMDVLSKVLELGLVVTLAVMLVRLPDFKPSFETTTKLVTVGFLGMSVALVSAGMFAHEPELPSPLVIMPSGTSSSSATPSGVTPSWTPLGLGSSGGLLPNWRGLETSLTRSGFSPSRPGGDVRTLISADLTYVPLLLYQASGMELPASSLDRPTAIFFFMEMDHEDGVWGIPPKPPQTLLSVDGGERIEPYEITIIDGGAATGVHRLSRLLFPLPSGLESATIDLQAHKLMIFLSLGGKLGYNTFSWEFPLNLNLQGRP